MSPLIMVYVAEAYVANLSRVLVSSEERIMNRLMTAAVASALVASVPAHADANPDLANEQQCTNCDAMKGNTLVPSFQRIALKYRMNPNAEPMLVATVMKGSADTRLGYHWSAMKMPSLGASPVLTEAEAKQLVRWVLEQKKLSAERAGIDRRRLMFPSHFEPIDGPPRSSLHSWSGA